MEYLGQPFQVVPALGPEQPLPGAGAAETAQRLAGAKAREVAQKYPQAAVIGADTVVEIDGLILGKPADPADAARMLHLLSGREHRVYTGVTVLAGEKKESAVECTRVTFREMTDREIDAYVATGEPMDKAGAYACQGRAGLYIERMEGDFFNVVGLPLCRLGLMLDKLGVFSR